MYASDDDFGCYNPWNLQTRYLTCHATRYVRDKKYDRLDGHHVVTDGRHHAGFGRTGDVEVATRRIASFSFVGVAEHYHASICIFAFWVRDLQREFVLAAATEAEMFEWVNKLRDHIDALREEARYDATKAA